MLERTPPYALLRADSESAVDRVREDWLRTRFIEYAHEALRDAEVVGLEEW